MRKRKPRATKSRKKFDDVPDVSFVNIFRMHGKSESKRMSDFALSLINGEIQEEQQNLLKIRSLEYHSYMRRWLTERLAFVSPTQQIQDEQKIAYHKQSFDNLYESFKKSQGKLS